MKLQEAFIEGYGRFHNRRLDLDAPVIVVYGPNEAGKSTLFGFLRTMLYGFARRSNPSLRAEPLHGGRHGGRLLFQDETGTPFYLLRHADEASGKPRLREASRLHHFHDGLTLEEKPMEQRDWETDYLGGIQERLFRGLFAVTLTELQEVGILSGAELGRHLYQAGWENGSAIAAAEKSINQELELLFKPKGTNQRVNASLKKLEHLEAEWRKLEDGIDSYNQLKQQEEAVGVALKAISERLPFVQSRHRIVRKALASRLAWMRKCLFAAEADKFRYTESLPYGAEEAWKEWLRKRQEADEKRDALKQEKDRLQRQRAEMAYDENLIDRAADIEAALQTAERMNALKQQLSEWDSELRTLDESIGEYVASISPDWTERQLRELTVTIADRDYARTMLERSGWQLRNEERLESELDALRAQEKEMMSLLDEADVQLRRAQQMLSDSEKGRFSIHPASKQELMAAWNELDDALREWELELSHSSDSQRSAAGSRNALTGNKGQAVACIVAGGAAIVLGVASAIGWLGEADLIGAAAAIGAGGIAVGLMISMRTKGHAADAVPRSANGRSRRRVAVMQGGEQRVREALTALMKDAEGRMDELLHRVHQSLTAQSGSAFRGMIRQEVQERVDAIGEYELWRSKHHEAESRLLRLRESIGEKAAGAKDLKRRAEAFAEQWRAWLAERSLSVTMSPAAALEAFEVAEAALERLKQYDRIAIRREDAVKELSQFEQRALQLCEGIEPAERMLRQDPVLGLQTLLAECRRHSDIRKDVWGLNERMADVSLELAAAESKLHAIGMEIDRIVEAAGLTMEAEYAAALEHRRLWTELEDERLKLELELTAGLSPGEWQEIEYHLNHADEEALSSEQEELQQEEARLVQEQQLLLERKGALRGAMEHLRQEEERQRLAAEREMILSGLDVDMERYAVLSVSKALIERTKRIYEQERQPVVLRNASYYMNKLTEGRYVRISADPSRAGIRVEDRDHAVLDSDCLSRGTAEQLYLSLRLALAKESSQGIKLPLMLDDLFVNFDGTRLKAAAALMGEVSEERQILFFTCHEHTRDALLAACPEAKLVELDPVAVGG